MYNDKYMDIAYDEAIIGLNAKNGGPFGAVITQGEKFISSAHNSVLMTKDPTAHAEINAIREASHVLNNYDLSDCTLYTTCEPCPMCLGAILWARIKTVYYTSTKDDATKAGFDDKYFYEMIEIKNININIQQINDHKSKKLWELWKKSNSKIY